MKKHIFLLLLLFAMPALVLPAAEEVITITKLSMVPVPFNERRDPAADSPYNAFDGDNKTAALYSDFTVEFSKPVTIDQLKVVNGNSSNKDIFKKNNRERDIEITLYTVAYKPDKKTEKKSKKSKTVQPKKSEKKAPLNDRDTKSKTEQETLEKEKTDKEKKEKEIKKTETPERVVMGDEYDTIYKSRQDDVKLYLAASETTIEPDKKAETVKPETVKKSEVKKETKKPGKKPVKVTPAAKKTPVKKKTDTKKTDTKKTDTKKTDTKKTDTKKPEKKNVSKSSSSKDKTPVKKTPAKKHETTVKKNEKFSSYNIIEITDSKKSVKKTENPAAEVKKNTESVKDVKTDPKKIEAGDTETMKSLAGDNNSAKPKTDQPVKKKTTVKKTEKKPAVKTNTKKTPAKTEPVKKETGNNKIEIVDSKSKTEKTKTPSVKKPADTKKTVKPETITVKPPAEKKNEPETAVKKENKQEIKKDTRKQTAEIKPAEDVKVIKMTGVVRIENDKDGRVLVYTSLKDSMGSQNIDLKGEYSVTKIDFRTRDDEYYTGSMPDRSAITEINLFNNGKRVTVQGIDALKKSYVERYTQKLKDSLTDETFIMYENNDVVLRMKFRKDGRMEFFDRFKCSKKGDADCTSLSMPDMWKVADGRLLMRYHTLWRVWKYELDSQNDMLSDDEEPLPPRWMKLYFKSDNGFTDQYLELYRSEKGIWAE
jgi:hypothetical protein